MDKQSDGRNRQSKHVTRSRILERACEMYFAGDLVHGDERLSLVLQSLGYTTGAGYQIWANQALFRDDLQVLVAQRLDFDSLGAAFIACIDNSDGDDLVQVVESLGQKLLHCIVTHEGFYLSLRFLALGPSCSEGVIEHLSDQRSRLEEALMLSLERFSGRVGGLPGVGAHGASELSISLLALLEGFALRARSSQDVNSGDRPFLSALAALFGVDRRGLHLAEADSRQS